MAVKDDIKWFKGKFGAKVQTAFAGTPLTLDILCAIALQETGYIWRKLVAKGLPANDVLRLCVGDVIDAPRRRAFPKNKEALIAQPGGQQMFVLAHALLIEMGNATGIESYINAGRNANKFCRGYGIFQRDLQFFKDDPDYFLNQAWVDFDRCLDEAVKELKKALRNLGYADKPSLTDLQLCFVAIVYNTGFGNFDEDRGLKQGFEDEDGVFYGEHIAKFLNASKAVPIPSDTPAAVQTPGCYVVSARPNLNLRGGPGTTFGIKQSLDNGTVIHVLEFVDGERGKWALVDIEGDGVRDGFVLANFIVPA
jgi:hypothetical protein